MYIAISSANWVYDLLSNISRDKQNEKHNPKACQHVMIKVTKQKPWKGTSMQSLPSTRAGIGGTERKMEDFHNNKLHN